jgi:hypothetical protein
MAGNYIAKLTKMIQEGKISAGSAQHVQVLHDSWCAIYSGRDCNCDPDFEVGPELVEAR